MAWFLGDTGSFKQYFLFLPSKSETENRPKVSRINNFEKKILDNPSKQSPVDFQQLIDAREIQKDWILSQLPIYVDKSISDSIFISPKSEDLLSPKFLEVLEEIYELRSKLKKKLEGGIRFHYPPDLRNFHLGLQQKIPDQNFLLLLHLALIFVLILRISNPSGNPFQTLEEYGGEKSQLFFGIICFVSTFFGYIFSQRLTFDYFWSKVTLIILFVVVGLNFGMTLISGLTTFMSAIIAASSLVALSLMIGVTGGKMREPHWFGDVLFMSQIKRLIENKVQFISCDSSGNFSLFDSSTLAVDYDDKNEIVMIKRLKQPLNFSRQ